MDIYLDANATTPVLPQARAAALDAMAESFGNPSSTHSTGLKARALVDEVRARARRLLGVPQARLLFVSGATEGIQTAVLSALSSLRRRPGLACLLYGATEHKAVPEALHHWNDLLGLGLQVLAIPVGRDGRHDLDWLREHAPRAGMVCTMAANNETGVISDLDGIADALSGSPALWMVDSVQALGKLPLDLARRPIDYAPFSGHKLYAPKGIGLLHVREGAPVTPLMAGGGQEGALRSGTENVSGIAALGAVLEALEDGRTFQDAATLKVFRNRLAAALVEAFPALQFNAPPDLCLPTTLNFSVPGLNSRLLLDLFDAADVRVSSGSACSAGQGRPSHVLQAMGLPEWRSSSAIRLSFGPAASHAFIDTACERIRACSAALRTHQLSTGWRESVASLDGVTRFKEAGACCYLLADADRQECVVIDPKPELVAPVAQRLVCCGYRLRAVLATGPDDTVATAARQLHDALPASLRPQSAADRTGWPLQTHELPLGRRRLVRLDPAGPAAVHAAFMLHDPVQGLPMVFVGDLLAPDFAPQPETGAMQPGGDPLQALARQVPLHALLLPAHDPGDRIATTLALESVDQALRLAGLQPAPLAEGADLLEGLRAAGGADEVGGAALRQLLANHPGLVLVDVREPYEQHLSAPPDLGRPLRSQPVPLSRLVNALPAWLTAPASAVPLLFFCRSGYRSAVAVRALRRLGHARAWSLAGGLALWQ